MVRSGAVTPSVQGPMPRTSLIGRECEIAAARALLLDEAAPLLTLIGPGGVGKTHLALSIAHALKGRFADGTVFFDLSSIRNSSLVLPTIAQAVGVRLDDSRPVTSLLTAALRPRQLLLILDNCEQIRDAGPGIADVLAGCPALQVLATSRAPLRLQAEFLLAIPPLPLPSRRDLAPSDLAKNPAVALFVARARAADPAFALTAANAVDVAAICAGLDGLPLAIELAAARLRLLSLDALRAFLADPLRLLTDGARDRPDRQRTLRHTIAWSYDLLAPGDQRAFEHLAVFAGGIDLEGAAAVLDVDQPEALDRLLALVDNSLIVRAIETSRGTRFRMLETVREFVATLAAGSEEFEAVRRRHALWCLSLAEQTSREESGPEHRSWQDRLALEIDNLRAALAWTVERGEAEQGLRLGSALWWFWCSRGLIREGRQWQERLLRAGDAAPPLVRALGMRAAGALADGAGDMHAAVTLLEASGNVARSLGDDALAAEAETALADLAVNRGEFEQAITHATEALALCHRAGNPAGCVWPQMRLGLAERRKKNFATARRHYQDALRACRTHGVSLGVPWVTTALGEVAADSGDAVQATTCFRDALLAHAADHSTLGVGFCLLGLGKLAAADGRPGAAARLLGATERLWKQNGDVLSRIDREEHDGCIAHVKAALGEAAFAAAWSAGRSQSLDEVLTEALSAAQPLPAPKANPFGLTPREREVLGRLAQRLTDAEIADALYISPHTVSTHVKRILAKLGAANRRDAAALAARHDLTRTDSRSTDPNAR